MSELLIVLQREFVERVRSRSFILSTLLVPVFLVGVIALPMLLSLGRSGGETRLALVDEAPAGVGRLVASELARQPERERDERFVVEHVRAPLGSVQDSLRGLVLAEQIDGYLWLPPDLTAGGVAHYRGRSVTDLELNQQIETAVTGAIHAARLGDAGLQLGEVAALLRPVRIEAARIDRGDDEGQNAASAFIFALVVGFALYNMILLYGAQVMQSVQEEKTNRIAEVLISSIRASELMLGKILGVSLVALLQVAIWMSAGAVLLSQRERFLSSLPEEVPQLLSASVGAGEAAALALFAVLGFLLYATLFAAAGAAAASSEDSQRFVFPLIVPLFIPIFLFEPLLAEPQGTLATTLGWFPFTAPLVMPMRMGAGGVEPLEVVGSLVLLTASVYLFGVLAGKIYRMGILSTGKRPTLREIGRWMRTA